MNLVPLNTLFRIKHGNKYDLNKMTQCKPHADAIAFVGRSRERNGVVSFVEPVSGSKPFEVGMITVALGGSTLASFVQLRPFYTAQNIDVLIPLFEMSLDVKLYYCLCIEANRFRYSTYGREANRTLKTLLVPSKESIPEWVEGSAGNAVMDLCHELQGLSEAIKDGEHEAIRVNYK